MKKIISLVIVLSLVLASAVIAFAQPNDAGIEFVWRGNQVIIIPPCCDDENCNDDCRDCDVYGVCDECELSYWRQKVGTSDLYFGMHDVNSTLGVTFYSTDARRFIYDNNNVRTVVDASNTAGILIDAFGNWDVQVSVTNFTTMPGGDITLEGFELRLIPDSYYSRSTAPLLPTTTFPGTGNSSNSPIRLTAGSGLNFGEPVVVARGRGGITEAAVGYVGHLNIQTVDSIRDFNISTADMLWAIVPHVIP